MIVAYDGSLQAALRPVCLRGVGAGQGREIQVVSIADHKQTALRHSDRAIEFLKTHGLEANPPRSKWSDHRLEFSWS